MMDDDRKSGCPGCALRLPPRPALVEHGCHNASPECWSVYTEVLAAEWEAWAAHHAAIAAFVEAHLGAVLEV